MASSTLPILRGRNAVLMPSLKAVYILLRLGVFFVLGSDDDAVCTMRSVRLLVYLLCVHDLSEKICSIGPVGLQLS